MLLCWESIEAYKHMGNEDRVKEAPILMHKFCDPSSVASISPDEDLVATIQNKLNSAPGSRNIFDDMQHFTWQMLEFGLCQKFIASEEYKKLQAVRCRAVVL